MKQIERRFSRNDNLLKKRELQLRCCKLKNYKKKTI